MISLIRILVCLKKFSIIGKGRKISLRTYIWIEDQTGKSSYTFWKTLTQNICPEIIVESKKNCSELVKAVRTLTNDGNRYVIALDNSFDNLQIYQERKLIKKYVDQSCNVFMINIICFEYILLEFSSLINWIYAPEDEFLIKRKSAIQARSSLVAAIQSGDLDYKKFQEVIDYDNKLLDHNIEQLSAKLLFDLTRNTGFEVSKSSIGNCWIDSCCNWNARQNDDICGLDTIRLSVLEKMKTIYLESSLCHEFESIGLEVAL